MLGFREALLGAAAVCTLSGCKIDTDADIFLSDVVKAQRDGAVLSTPVSFRLEIASKSQCEDASAAFVEALQKAYSTVEYLGCGSENLENFVAAKVMATLISASNQSLDSVKEPVYIVIEELEGRNGVDIAFRPSSVAIQSIRDSLAERLKGMPATAPDVRLSARVHNDLGEKVEIEVSGVFANGQAVPSLYSKGFSVAHRDLLTVRLSDVSNQGFSNVEYQGFIATVPLPAVAEATQPAAN